MSDMMVASANDDLDADVRELLYDQQLHKEYLARQDAITMQETAHLQRLSEGLTADRPLE